MSQSLEIFWWTLTVLLMLAGLLGAIIPVLPDSLLILGGAVLQHFTIHSSHRVGWWTLGILALLSVIAHALDFVAGAVGAKRYGASRWGVFGGFVGGVVGLSFFPVGIFLGPIIGVLCAEVIFAHKTLGPAVKSSWGTLLGTTAGIICKILVDFTMIAVFFVAAFR